MKTRSYLIGAAFACTTAFAASAGVVTIEKPYFRWLFGGFGFQHSEANLTALMSDDFRDQRVLKTFAELMPTFGRVYTGFANQSREQMDRFADYYDLTFRKAGTTLYAVPCGMPLIRPGDDPEEYAGKVAENLEYLIKTRKCRKIRYYCLSNELMVGDRWNWFERSKKMDVYKTYNEALFDAFRRRALDVKIIATDISAGPEKANESLEWARTNMNDVVGAFVSHWYVTGHRSDDVSLWGDFNTAFGTLVQTALKTQKRFILGEYGFHPAGAKRGVMQDDVSYHLRQPETAAESVLTKCEIALAAMNQGALAAVDWSFVDYPDPFVIEDGDTPEEHARYEAGKCGYKLDHKYNKCGIFRWCTTDHDYSSYHEMYAMGHIVRLFRKDATVLPCKTDDDMLRPAAVINPDRTISIAVINRGPAQDVTIDCSTFAPRTDGQPTFAKPLRRYVYDSAHVPFNPFNDLQPASGTVATKNGNQVTVALPAKSITFLTTAYEDVVPEAVTGVKVVGGKLMWRASASPDHRYYRVFCNGKQIASTVATTCTVTDPKANYVIRSVDRWGNVSR